MQYSKIRIIVGFFVLVIFAVIASFLYVVLEEKGTFEKRHSYHFNTASAESFHVGMPLKFSGFNVGVIDLMKLRPDGSVRMEFSVPNENEKWITKDSVLMIKKPLIGSAHIELYSAFGNEPLKYGGELLLLMSDDINDMIDKLHPLVERVVSIVTNLDKITKNLSKDDSDLNAIFSNAKNFTQKLSDDDSVLTTLTGSKKSTQDFKNSLKSLAKMMQNIQQISANLNEDIVLPASSSIQELELILKDVNQKLKELDNTVKAVGGYDEDLSEIKIQLNSGLQKSNEIMDKVDAILSSEKNEEVKLP